MAGFRCGRAGASLSIAVLILLLSVLPNCVMAVPFIDFVNQSPADLTTFNIFNDQLNITYNITDPLGLNGSSVAFNYKTNTSLSDVTYYINGTAWEGWILNGHVNMSNSSEIWQFLLANDEVYPATYNFDEDYMEATPKSAYDLDEGDEYVKIQMLNVSNAKNYSFFEIYAENQTGSSNTLRMYYCNSSYSTGNPATNANCVQIYDLTRFEPFNHTHSAYSKHHVIPFAINSTTGIVGDVKVTSTSYFLMRGRLGANSWNIYYITNVSRTDAIQFSTNNGGAWSDLSGTVDAHLHQYDGEDTFRYYVCANSSGDGSGNCSVERYDLINLSGIPPNPPFVYSPAEDAAYNSSIPINYTAALSPNGYDISFYNISLYNSDDTFNSTIYTNNSLNLSYLWNPAGIDDGDYMAAVEACDNQSQCSTGFSGLFSIDTIAPSPAIQMPANTTYNYTLLDFNYTSYGLHNDSCWYVLNGGADVPLPGCANTTFTAIEGQNTLTLYANDTAGNLNSTNVSFSIDSIAPSVAIQVPANSTYNYTSLDLNYTASDLYMDSCWYVLNGGADVPLPGCANSTFTAIEGQNTLTLYANDTFGNTNSTNVSFTIDSTSPSLSIQSPLAGAFYHQAPVGLNYTASDTHLDSCWYSLDGGASIPLAGCLNSSISPANGGHSLELFANDTSGNINSTTVSFTMQVPGQPSQSEPRLSAEWERACPGNGILISASGGGNPLEGVEVRLVLREPNAGEIARGITGSDGSILFNAPINGTYNAYLELSGYTYDNPLAFAYTTCAPEGAPEIPECKENADCAMSEYCGAGACVPVECACGVISSHACDAYECCSDSGCPTGFACDGNECVEKTECRSDSECGTGKCSAGRCAAETPEPETGTQPTGSEPATGSQPSGTSPEVPGTQPPGACASDGDCAPGFGCEGGSCRIIGGAPAAGADGAVSPGGVGTVQQPASGELPLPWWVIPEAMAFGAVTFAAGAYSMHWWMNRRK